MDPVWLCLWVACGLTVGGLEAIALWRPNQGDTLSENLRRPLRRRPWVRWLSLAIWVGFSIWFAYHIWFS